MMMMKNIKWAKKMFRCIENGRNMKGKLIINCFGGHAKRF